MIHPGGQNICGVSIGVLCLESYFPKPPGHIKNPSSMEFSVLYETIKGITVPKLLANPSDDYLQPLIDAAKRLEAEGVRAITGSCGFLAIFQKQLAQAVSVPVFASSLIQVPLAYHMSGAHAPVGVITASAPSLTQKHLDGVGAGNIPIVVRGLEESEEFAEVILRNDRTSMDLAKVEQELLCVAHDMIKDHADIRSIVLECTDLPPYAHRLQQELKLPVFDIITLANMVHDIAVRRPFTGFMPY